MNEITIDFYIDIDRFKFMWSNLQLDSIVSFIRTLANRFYNHVN